MRILWDLRLFSHGYGRRGVGRYVRSMVRAVGERKSSHEIVAWANKNDVPGDAADVAQSWIPYFRGSWKSDLVRIPYLAARHRIDVVHYWMAMGPVFRIGMGLPPPCKTLATVYDIGVEHNPDDPYCAHARTTWYWRCQKYLLGRVHAVAYDSQKTRSEVHGLLGRLPAMSDVIYPPIERSASLARPRDAVFVTLGGAPHKNLTRVVEAFLMFRKTHPSYRLAILGESAPADLPNGCPDGVIREPMSRYEQLLDTCAGLVCCSTYEGLGIPPLEAMAHACPLVASNIEPFRETCDGAACFADPRNPASIAEALRVVANDTETWSARSDRGCDRYRSMSAGAGSRWLALYDALCSTAKTRV